MTESLTYQDYITMRANCLQMAQDRHWTILEDSPPTKEQFEMQQNLDLQFTYQNKEIYVKFIYSNLTNKGVFNTTLSKVAQYYHMSPSEYQEHLQAGSHHVVIIAPAVSKQYNDNYLSNETIELFIYDFFKINPTKHVYQPKFQLIKDPEHIRQIYRQLNATPDTLGAICLDDPIVRWYGALPASKNRLPHIFKIIRNGQQVAYRQVSNTRMNK